MSNIPVPAPRYRMIGSLIKAMQAAISFGDKLGVLVIDEVETGCHTPELMNQVHVLEFAKRQNVPVIAVEINQGVFNDPHTLAINTKRKLMPFVDRFVNKVSFNAFEPNGTHPDLIATLRTINLFPYQSKLVIMGYSAGQCVRLSIFGGASRPTATALSKPGAIDLGYIIMTSPDVLRGDGNTALASWKTKHNLLYFERI